MNPRFKIIGKQICWEKVSGTYTPRILVGDRGFGILITLELDRRMVIAGDYGVTTSVIREIHSVEGTFKVTTENSVYLVKEVK